MFTGQRVRITVKEAVYVSANIRYRTFTGVFAARDENFVYLADNVGKIMFSVPITNIALIQDISAAEE